MKTIGEYPLVIGEILRRREARRERAKRWQRAEQWLCRHPVATIAMVVALFVLALLAAAALISRGMGS